MVCDKCQGMLGVVWMCLGFMGSVFACVFGIFFPLFFFLGVHVLLRFSCVLGRVCECCVYLYVSVYLLYFVIHSIKNVLSFLIFKVC